MSKSYYPTDRAGQIQWHNNFAVEFPKVGPQLGFSHAEIGNAVADSKYAAYLLKTLGPELESQANHPAFVILEGQSSGDYVNVPGATEATQAVRPGIDTRRQARVERIKRHSNYNETVRQQLSIGVAPLDERNYQAELGKPRQTGPTVTIPFRKAGGKISGINLYRQRKGPGAPEKVGFFMRTPAIDTDPGTSGQLIYTARAVKDGDQIGQSSDPVTITLS